MEQEMLQAPVAVGILAVTIVVSIIAFYNSKLKALLLLHPYSTWRGKRWYTLLTSGFVHKDWPHLVFNMLFLYVFAFKLEKEFLQRSEWGHLQLGLLYVFSIVLSNGSTIVRYKDDFWYNSLGASGGVLALMMSYILFHPFDKLYLIPFLPPLPLIAMLFVFIAGLIYAEKKRRKDNVNNYAHFTGCICGVVITGIYYPALLLEIIDKLQNI